MLQGFHRGPEREQGLYFQGLEAGSFPLRLRVFAVKEPHHLSGAGDGGITAKTQRRKGRKRNQELFFQGLEAGSFPLRLRVFAV